MFWANFHLENQKLVYIAELPDPKNPQNKNHRMDHLGISFLNCCF